jgi:hypothetical protein
MSNSVEWEKARAAAKSMPDGPVVECWSGRLAGEGKFLGYKQCTCVVDGYKKAANCATAHGYIRAGNAQCT